MPGQDPTPDRQPPVVWLVDEAAEILGRPESGKTPQVAALTAQIAAIGHRIGIVITHPKAAPVAAVVDDGGMSPAACAVCGDPLAWHPPHALVAETVDADAGSADRACGDGAVSQ